MRLVALSGRRGFVGFNCRREHQNTVRLLQLKDYRSLKYCKLLLGFSSVADSNQEPITVDV